jgi:hypothetical protein
MLLHARPLLGAVLAAAALASAGCGSSSPSTADKKPASTAAARPAAPAAPDVAKGPAPTKAAFVRRADAVCRQAADVSRSANTVVRTAFAAKDVTKAADAIDNYTPLFAKHVDEFRALRRPAHDTKLVAGLITVMDTQVRVLRAEVVALRQHDTATLSRVLQAQQQQLQFAEALGKNYGFKVCGRASA